jgi:hypothetical protein
MPELQTVIVLHTTSLKENAHTNADFVLEITHSGPRFRKEFPSDMEHRELGRTDVYPFDVRGQGIDSDDPQLKVIMRMLPESVDGWLPQAIYVVGYISPDETVLLGDHSEWRNWFDRGVGAEGVETHTISGGFTVKGGGSP